MCPQERLSRISVVPIVRTWRKRGRRQALAGATAALLTALVVPCPADAQTSYAFTPIYTFTPTPDAQISIYCVGMNYGGTVIVNYIQSLPGMGPELWRGDGQSFTPVAQNVSTLCASINDSGEIAYGRSTVPGVATLVRNSNGTTTPLAASNAAPFFSQTHLPAISANGSVLLHGSGDCAGSAPPPWGIYVVPSGPTVYECADFTFDFTGAVSMNDNQVVAFVARRAADGTIGVYRGPGSTPLVADTGFIGSAAVAVINNSGTVAFAGVHNGAFALYSTLDGDTVTRVSDPSLSFQSGHVFSITTPAPSRMKSLTRAAPARRSTLARNPPARG